MKKTKNNEYEHKEFSQRKLLNTKEYVKNETKKKSRIIIIV